ncbi:uncharacterized protein PHACADRAFT_260311 [Phanerochaete carnosa HHB-10118-sp]|uniref:NAD-dependent protein deacylase n=1 Tax=Phanerochaete carnosa (strain HHB-10118-sp) TaxID=650164 RepID=K5W4E1_PHACS|nr:uncharacterized protein PHACADRAFT_260311 [Phanerochaete carnosa HHB-10118-sp]EKM53789.1 hypothetical protein PHACADRAFT_260311 [Phanerochaete carnosa HHB-10118-sp]
MSPSTSVTAFREALKQSKNIIAVAGAGLSAASGIPTFRGAGGYWKKYNAMSLATPEAFEENPSLVWQFYHYRRMKALSSRPNAAHVAISMISFPDFLREIAPEAKFTFITQNVDGLSARALKEVAAKAGKEPSQAVPFYEMHGRILDLICTSCGRRSTNQDEAPLCPALAATGALPTDPNTLSGVDTEEVADIPLEELPRCEDCGGLLRPGVVWFGETPLHMEQIDGVVAQADMCLVVGTSSTVYPAASYASEVAENGGKVAVFNLERTEGDSDADFLFLGPCEQTLPEALFGLSEAKQEAQ